MEVGWLEDFLVLESCGVFARAAQARNISQSAFTRRIKNLEYAVGATLFDRSVHPVVLTPAGEAFRRTAYETVNALRTARDDLKQLTRREGELLQFTALHTLAISFVPRWLKDISAKIGPLNTKFNVENFSGCVEALISGTSDFTLCYHHPAVPTISSDTRYPSIKIADDQLLPVSAVGFDGQPLFDFDKAGLQPFLAYPHESFLGRLTAVAIERAGLSDKLSQCCENSVAEALKAACLEGLGIAWLPRCTIEECLKERTLVQIGDSDTVRNMTVRLYRSLERSRPTVERVWALAESTSIFDEDINNKKNTFPVYSNL